MVSNSRRQVADHKGLKAAASPVNSLLKLD